MRSEHIRLAQWQLKCARRRKTKDLICSPNILMAQNKISAPVLLSIHDYHIKKTVSVPNRNNFVVLKVHPKDFRF